MEAAKRRRATYPPARLLHGEDQSLDELLAIDIFQGITAEDMAMRPGTVVRRNFKKGDIICRQGDGGTTAYYIVSGTAKVFVELPPKPEKNWLGRTFDLLRGRHKDVADKLIANDASVELSVAKPEATLGPTDIFGELSCMHLTPRAATVQAAEDCVMIEMLRNVLELLQKKSRVYVERADHAYRERALLTHLKAQPYFAPLSPEDLSYLGKHAELRRYEPGESLFQQGDSARDPQTGGIFIVRSGHVQVITRSRTGRERTLAYRSKGECVGEIGFLHDDPDRCVRGATCKAASQPIDYGEQSKSRMALQVVRIAAEHLDHVIQRNRRVRGALALLGADKVAPQPVKNLPFDPLEVKQAEAPGLWQGQNLMFIDLTRCTRCDYCVDACVAAHDDGVSRLVREGPRQGRFLVPSSCRQCVDPVCMLPCPVGAIRKSESGSIVVEDWCFGCELCAEACPYDAIQMHSLSEFGNEAMQRAEQAKKEKELIYVTLQRAVVCDQCESLPTGPACVYACPHDAALRFNAAAALPMAMDDRSLLQGEPRT